MPHDETSPELLAGRADDAAVFKRTMNIVATGCEYLAAALARAELDEAINIARRISNIWIDGHAAYYNLVRILGIDAPGMSTARCLLGQYQCAVIALLDEMTSLGAAAQVRAAAMPLRERLTSLVLPESDERYS